jgi:hypothetical protein
MWDTKPLGLWVYGMDIDQNKHTEVMKIPSPAKKIFFASPNWNEIYSISIDSRSFSS